MQDLEMLIYEEWLDTGHLCAPTLVLSLFGTYHLICECDAGDVQ
jgi:hypothetical protein